MDEGKYGPLLETIGIQVYYLRLPPGKARLSAFITLLSLLRRLRPDAVQCWMYHANLFGGLAAKLAGISKIFWGIHHSTLEPADSKRSTRIVSSLCALLSGFIPKKIVFCSSKATDIHKGYGYNAKKFVVIPNGYDIQEFKPDGEIGKRLRHQLGINEGTFVVGLVARFHPMKDHGNLLRALTIIRKSLENFHCLLIGTGITDENNTLNALIMQFELGKHISLLGRRDDIPVIMNAIDLYSSSSSGEAFPNVLAEAMACETPCVTTDVGDAALIVGDSGWVVPPKDAAALARAILAAHAEAQNPAAWNARKQQARERIARHFTIEQMGDAYVAIWST
jgi:glycosyltransferase involved in cell wall biosynthesis